MLKEHLLGSAAIAEYLGNRLSPEIGERARLVALLHDLGKYHDSFQRRIRGEEIAAEHAAHGAVLAADARALDITFAIAAHHAGLKDMGSTKSLLTRASHNTGCSLKKEAQDLLVIAEADRRW